MIDGYAVASDALETTLTTLDYEIGECTDVSVGFLQDLVTDTGETGEVILIVDGGSPVSLATYNSDTSDPASIDISQYIDGASTFSISFRYADGVGEDAWWAIDNFAITAD